MIVRRFYGVCLLAFLLTAWNHLAGQDRIAPVLSGKTDSDPISQNTAQEVLKEVLVYYPELQNTPIRFANKKLRTVMATRPVISSLFRKREKREYTIFVNTSFLDTIGLFYLLDPLARKGIMGHELAHIYSYSRMSSVRLLGHGMRYGLSRKHIENHTDEIAISRGLGWEVHAYATIAFNPGIVGWDYFLYKIKNYCPPRRIAELTRILSESSPEIL